MTTRKDTGNHVFFSLISGLGAVGLIIISITVMSSGQTIIGAYTLFYGCLMGALTRYVIVTERDIEGATRHTRILADALHQEKIQHERTIHHLWRLRQILQGDRQDSRLYGDHERAEIAVWFVDQIDEILTNTDVKEAANG